mgnify:FL=1
MKWKCFIFYNCRKTVARRDLKQSETITNEEIQVANANLGV